MAIDLSGDVIYFDGRPVGFITVPNGSLRAGFEELLTESEVASEIRQLQDELRDAEDEASESNGVICDALQYVKKNYPNDEELIEMLS